MKSSRSKPTVVIQPGPIHLFWTSGVYYYWLLKNSYNVVMYVAEHYRDDKWFNDLVRGDLSTKIHYFYDTNSYANHVKHKTEIQKILKDTFPKFILMHSEFYVENLYLTFFANRKSSDSILFYYQNGRVSLRFAKDFASRTNVQAQGIISRARMPQSFRNIAHVLVKLRNELSAILNHKVFPYFTIGCTFAPRINLLTGAIKKNLSVKNQSPIHLCYLSVEEQAIKRLGIENTRIIQHPLTQCAGKVFEHLYCKLPHPQGVLVLPSYGYIEMSVNSGMAKVDIVTKVSDDWLRALLRICEIYRTNSVSIKLHPASKSDSIWQEIISKIKYKIPQLVVLPINEPAEYHVMKHEIIVGDVSSSLWWAGILGNKIVFSLDIFDYCDGDELKEYDEILHYINDTRNIKKFEAKKIRDSSSQNLNSILSAP